MSQTNMQKWLAWIKEWKLGIFLFVNAIFFTAVFYSDISRRADIGSREIIGDIVYKYNRTQRKFNREVSWNPIDSNNPVTNLDSIKTEKNSVAAIQLKDGTEIEMDEESMVILEISPKQRKVRFEQGSINIKKREVEGDTVGSITVESPKGTVRVKDGDVIVAKNSGTAMDVAVSRGEAMVEVDGQAIQLKKNQMLHTTDEGISAMNASVQMIDPIEKVKRLQTKANQDQNKLNLSQTRATPSSQTTSTSTSASTTTRIQPTKTSPKIESVDSTPKKEESKEIPAPSNSATSPGKQQEATIPQESKTKVETSPKPTNKVDPSHQEKLDDKEIQRRKEQAEFERFMKM